MIVSLHVHSAQFLVYWNLLLPAIDRQFFNSYFQVIWFKVFYMCKKTTEYLESCGQINRLIKIGLSGGFNIPQTVDRFMSNFRALLISGKNCFDAQFLGALAVVADFLSSQQRVFCQIGFKSRIRF